MSTADFPLDTVATFADLRILLNRLHTRAGKPSLRTLETRASASAGCTPLPRSKLSRILRGAANPSRDDLTTFAQVCGVPDGEILRWWAAWGRAAEQPFVTEAAPAPGTAPRTDPAADARRAAGRPEDTQPDPGELGQAAQREIHGLATEAERIRADMANALLEIQRRCAARLRSLVADVARARGPAPADTSAPPAPVEELYETVDRALRQVEEIIGRAYQEVTTIPVVAPGKTAPAVGPTAQPDTADNVVSWFLEVIKHVDEPIAAELLHVMKDGTAAHRVAMARPLLMSGLLQRLSPQKVVDWMATWPPEASAETFATLNAEIAAEYLELLPPEQAGGLLELMSRGSARQCLVVMDRGRAAERLVEMARSTVGELLKEMDRAVVAECLMQLDPTREAEFLRLLPPEAASQCLELIDRRKAEQFEAARIRKALKDRRADADT